jgi:putative sigma-54 modulation protein
MRVAIRNRDSGVTEADSAYCLRRVRLALRRFEQRIERVIARLKDENGPRGGVDKHCQLVIAIPGVGELVIDSAHSEIRAAIDVASGRAKQSVARHLGRRRGGSPLRVAT